MHNERYTLYTSKDTNEQNLAAVYHTDSLGSAQYRAFLDLGTYGYRLATVWDSHLQSTVYRVVVAWDASRDDPQRIAS